MSQPPTAIAAINSLRGNARVVADIVAVIDSRVSDAATALMVEREMPALYNLQGRLAALHELRRTITGE